MITWARFPFLRLTPALLAGVVAALALPDATPDLAPLALAAALLTTALGLYLARRRAAPTAAAALAPALLLSVALLGAVRTQHATEARRPDHLGHFAETIEAYRAVVDDYTVVRPATYATTLRVSEVRRAGRWQPAVGGIRISLPRVAGIAAPSYGQVYVVRGHPDRSKAPLNPGEFDYRRYLDYRQVYHQQYIHPDQYRIVGLAPPNLLVAISMRCARQLDAVFRQYLHQKREYAIASALVLGIKDDVDADTKSAYTATGTTHIMAVSGLQVGLVFLAFSWLMKRLFGRFLGHRRGYRLAVAGLALVVVWSYAFLTGLSASVLRAAVMFSFIIVGRALERPDTVFNTLATAAFALLLWNPFLVADVGFQLSFLAVLSIVYLQPRIAGWLAVGAWLRGRQRSWQPRPVRWAWRAAAWSLETLWQATALSLAAQVATFPLSLYYFHQFPLSFLCSNLVAVPISSYAVYVGLALLLTKGVVALVGLALPPFLVHWLDYLPQAVGRVFEFMVWCFNEYIFWISRVLAGAVVDNIRVTAPETLLLFAGIGLGLAYAGSRRRVWLRAALGAAGLYAGSRVATAAALGPAREFVVYSIPRRSAVGFWRGNTALFVTPDSLPLTTTERTYRLRPGLIQRGARHPAFSVGWRGCPLPVRRLADADSAAAGRYARPGPLVLATWQGLRLGFLAGRLSAATRPVPLDVLVLRRNARLQPETLAAVFGPRTRVVFDSSCKIWYVARLDSALQARGFRTWDVTERGAFYLRPGRKP